MAKSFRQKDLDDKVEDIIQFCMNFGMYAVWVILMVGVMVGVHKCDGNKNGDCKKQPEQTCQFTPRKIKKPALDFYTAKQIADNYMKLK